MAASKTVPPERILEVAAAGVKDFGENRIQEADSKRAALADSQLTHHFIGHLQTNKAKRAVDLFDLIQSVDSSRLAETLDRAAGAVGKKQMCLVEVKISTEPTKMGMSVEQADGFIKDFSQYKNLELRGLMTIAPHDQPVENVRPLYAGFSKFFNERRSYFKGEPVLSMGMSEDFEEAIEEGSTMVRIGRLLFGERQKQ